MEPWLIILIIVLSIIILVLLLSYIMATVILKKSFQRIDFVEDREYISYKNIKDKYDRCEYEFKSKKNILKGYLYKKEESNKLVVYVHGMCPGHQGYLSDIIALLDRGYSVFTYDFTATGASSGKTYSGLDQQRIDLENAIKFLKENRSFGYQKIYLYGHSMGGYAVGCVKDEMFNAIVSISGYDSPISELLNVFGKNKNKAFKLLASFMIRIKYLFSEGTKCNIKAHKILNKTNISTLVIHGTNDELVDYKDVSIISKKDLINNDKVKYLTIDDEMHNTHNSIIASDDCVKYQKERMEIFNKVLEETKSRSEAFNAMIKDIDIFKFNEANKELMDIIDNFYKENEISD